MTDPVHPNWDGIAFRATTDKLGIVVTPTSAQTLPPYSYLPVAVAIGVLSDLQAVVHGIVSHDPQSYFATYLIEICDDLIAAIEVCRPKPEFDDAPSADPSSSAAR